MSQPTRQQRRAAEKQARQYYETRGLPPGGEAGPLIVHARELRGILADRANPGRAADAADLSMRSYERSARFHPPPERPACARGCAFCCNAFVVATAPEIFRLARHLRARPAAERDAALARLATAAAATVGPAIPEGMLVRRPCGLLEERACSAYPARPLVCRAGNSLDARACEAALHDPRVPMPMQATPMLLKDGHMLCLVAALRATGLDGGAWEINGALLRAANDPAAERRWLDGADVFAGVPQGPPPPPAHAAFLDRLTASVRA